jgi:hypothetical protein
MSQAGYTLRSRQGSMVHRADNRERTLGRGLRVCIVLEGSSPVDEYSTGM